MLKPWQEYLFSIFKKEEYVAIPDFIPLHNMWRHATWDAFVYDTVECNGTQMAAILSMAYRPRVIVEFGVDAGLTTLQFCKLNLEARVYGVDVCSRGVLSNGMPKAFHAMMNDVTNLTLVIGRPSWEFSMPGQVDMCFIDADHLGESPWKDTQRAWENRNTAGDWCIIWDDYHPSNRPVVYAADRLCAESGMELHQVGSWFYIGNLPHQRLRDLGCTT